MLRNIMMGQAFRTMRPKAARVMDRTTRTRMQKAEKMQSRRAWEILVSLVSLMIGLSFWFETLCNGGICMENDSCAVMAFSFSASVKQFGLVEPSISSL